MCVLAQEGKSVVDSWKPLKALMYRACLFSPCLVSSLDLDPRETAKIYFDELQAFVGQFLTHGTRVA